MNNDLPISIYYVSFEPETIPENKDVKYTIPIGRCCNSIAIRNNEEYY